MTWNNNLAIGVKEIDHQHKLLCDSIDNLLDACKTGKGRTQIISTMNFLFEYTSRHFKDEEIIQKRCGYPKCEAHKKLHDGFIQRIDDMKQDIIKNGVGISTVSELNTMLLGWLLNHIKKVDTEIAQYVK